MKSTLSATLSASGRRLVVVSSLLSVLFAFVVAPYAGAASLISQSYSSTEPLAIDSIVSLKENSSDEVVAANHTNAANLLGIVVGANSSSLSLTNNLANQVQVATSGTLRVLVSDINGIVERGDYITASPITGVGMKATDNARIIGVAQGSFEGGANQTIKDDTGKDQQVMVGEIAVLVNVSSYFKQPEKTLIPSSIQNIANAFAGRNVNPLPILISAGIFVVTLITVMIIVYSMIRNGIISVGRNPLSQSAVYRNVIQMSGLVIGILGASFIAIYLVLTKL
ncbi:MAG: hypothetical protein ABIP50_01145 [Candidatus Saccharimonadales bacterium]